MPYSAGSVRMLPYLTTTESTECVTGSECTVALPGYGIPSTLVVAGVLDGAYGSGTVCGMGSGLVAVSTFMYSLIISFTIIYIYKSFKVF